MTLVTLKEKIHNLCHQLVKSRLTILRQQLSGLAEAVANETKSTAGDKYETSRAMLHIEQDQVRGQIAALLQQQAVLDTIDPAVKAARVALGSLVLIGSDYYYISIGLGRMQVEGHSVVVLSLQSPLGAKLRGLGAGDRVVFNGKEITVTDVI